jgi:predicted acetyltransferase
MDALELASPTLALADSYIALCAEEIAHYSELAAVLPTTREAVADYVRKCETQESEGDEASDGIPQSTYWLVRNGTDVVGESQLKHRVRSEREAVGGHLNYGVRRSERGKGYGSRLLALTIEKARGLGIPRLLAICRKDNAASIGVIARNGGVLEGEVANPNNGKTMLRYWFDLT